MCRHLRNENQEYLKDKINEPEGNSKNKNIRDLHRGMDEFKKTYKPTTNFVKDENGDLPADPHNILIKWKNYFPQLLKVHEITDVRQTEIHTSESLVSGPSPPGVETAVEKF
jgi:hypothetical protein